MRIRDEVIASYLDDEWRTPPAVHRLLGDGGTVADIASALERLARAGKIEAKHKAVMAPRYRDKAGPPVLCIDFYRKLQRRTPQHGDEGAGRGIQLPSCAYRKSSPSILMMQSTQDRTAQNASRCLGGT
jgi:hypothetical protein